MKAELFTLARRTITLVTLLVAAPLRADTIPASDSGWRASTGQHDGTNPTFVVGRGPAWYRDFFVFDLSHAKVGPLSSAELQLYMQSPPFTYGYFSPNPSETFLVGAVSTPIATLEATMSPSPAGVAVYEDLGAGILYGSRTVSAADQGTWVKVALNDAFLAAITPLLGSGEIALGGRLAGEGPAQPENTYVFASSGGGHSRLVLDYATVPEPGATALSGMVLALGGAATGLRHLRKRQS